MSLARPLFPPIAPPLRPAQILRSWLAPADPPDAFALALARESACRGAALFASGRGALAAALSHWASPGRDEVVVPAYTCWSVPAAVVRAGLRVRLVDVDPATFDIDAADLAAQPLDRAVALLPTHLFGRSSDANAHAAAVRARDPRVRVVEDASQWWPGPARADVDAVLLSFGRGKPVATGGGGALLFPAAEPLSGPAPRDGGGLQALELVGQLALARPGLFRVAARLPFLGVGRTVYDPGEVHPDAGPLRWQLRLGVRVLGRWRDAARRRTENARALLARIGAPAGWSVPPPAVADAPLRFPLLAPDAATRERALHELRALGVAASAMYPGALDEIPALAPHLAARGPCAGARDLRARVLTLPCYPGLTPADAARVADAFARAADRARR